MKLCFLWHQHQPDYRWNGEFRLPWVQMHATKDYLDIPLLLSDYPVKHTFNLVPSLIDQLDSASQGMADPVSKLCMIHPQERTPSHEHALAQWILTLQHTQLADTPYLLQLRHTFELLAQARQPLLMLSDQEWINSLALLLWAWTGPVSRKRATICGYGHPSRDFIHADLETLLSEHRSIIAEISPTLVHLEHCGKIEVSVSPSYRFLFQPTQPLNKCLMRLYLSHRIRTSPMQPGMCGMP